MNSKEYTDECLKRFLKAIIPVCNVWNETYNVSEKSETRVLSKFFKKLGRSSSCRLFGLAGADFDSFVDGKPSVWKTFCLNHVRSKIAIHVKSAIEALEAVSSLGQINIHPRNIDSIRHVIDDLRAMATWMELYTRNGQRVLELAVKENRFQNIFEISPIDTELFAACWLVELNSYENEDIRIEAERKISHAIELNLFGTKSPVVKDSANLWWALKLAIRRLNDPKHSLLDRLPGGTEDLLGKCIKILNLACLQDINHPIALGDSTPHPLDYTPEIYTKEKTYGFILLNALKIESVLTSNSTFRREPAFWHILEKLDEVVDKCWKEIKKTPLSELNLYTLSLFSNAVAHWLVECRTNERWQHFMLSYDVIKPKNKYLDCSSIIRCLDKNPLKGVVSSNVQFSEQIKTVRKKMIEFLQSDSCKHPFTIAICGPPGSGKTHLAKRLLSAVGITNTISTHNLASHFPKPEDIWIEKLEKVVSCGGFKNVKFQGVIIDEADSVNPQLNGDQNAFAYQWLLEPLWEEWPDIKTKTGAVPTFVFIISSRYWTWSKWYHDALKPNVSKGRDFVSRIDESVDLPPMSPEDQLLMASMLFMGLDIPRMTIKTARTIALATFENQGRSIEALKKQCRIKPAHAAGCLDYRKHFPDTGNYRPEALTMRESV
jgi:hypothetical protein